MMPRYRQIGLGVGITTLTWTLPALAQVAPTSESSRNLLDLVDWLLFGLNGIVLLILALMAFWISKKAGQDDLQYLEIQINKLSNKTIAVLNRHNQKLDEIENRIKSQAGDIKDLKRGISIMLPGMSPPSNCPPPATQTSPPPFNYDKASPPPDPKNPQVIIQKFLDNPQTAISEYSPLALVVPMKNINARRHIPATEVQLEQCNSLHQANYLAFETYNGLFAVLPRLDFYFQSSLIKLVGLDYLYELENLPKGNAGMVTTIQVAALMLQNEGHWHMVEKGRCAF